MHPIICVLVRLILNLTYHMDQPKVKEYSNGEVTIRWQPKLCIHSEKCWRGLPEVFDPQARPWINPEGASTKDIILQVRQCPSGALSYALEDGESEKNTGTQVELAPNGPLIVSGPITLKGKDGEMTTLDRPKVALCRCGQSSNKPFCDGTHSRVGWES